ncbi:MAG: alginate export family protein, partial [Planctomycetes bacterium]|nr:alginate export family protein [Planctomycetota bacterium]
HQQYNPLTYLDWGLAKVSPAASTGVERFTSEVMDQPDVGFRFHGDDRMRGEARSNFDFASTGSQDDWAVLQRAMFDFRWKVRDAVTARAVAIDAKEWVSREVRPRPRQDVWDLFEGFIDVNQWDEYYFPFLLRGGRFRLELGSERLVGSDEWDNVPRSFDGAELIFKRPEIFLEAEVFLAFEVGVDNRNFNNGVNDVDFYGFYGTFSRFPTDLTGNATLQDVVDRTSLDLFALFKRDKDNFIVGEDGQNGDMDVTTLGFEAHTALWRQVALEGFWAAQIGNYATDSISAWAYGAGATWHFFLPGDDRVRWRAKVETSRASGDSDPRDGRRETFDQLYPASHGRYGVIDAVGLQNLAHAAARLGAAPWEGLDLEGSAHLLRLDTSRDAWYGPRRQVVRTAARVGASQRDLGVEYDLTAAYRFSPRISFDAGYARLYPGFRASATDRVTRPSDFFYAGAALSF